MRKKLDKETKRSEIIAIKVKPDVKAKINYLSEMQATKMSTYINDILEEHIRMTTKLHKIDWSEIEQ